MKRHPWLRQLLLNSNNNYTIDNIVQELLTFGFYGLDDGLTVSGGAQISPDYNDVLQGASWTDTLAAYKGRFADTSAEGAALGSELMSGWANGTTYPVDVFSTDGTSASAQETTGNIGGIVGSAMSVTAGEAYQYELVVASATTSATNWLFNITDRDTGAGTSVVNESISITNSGSPATYTGLFTVKSTDTTAYPQIALSNTRTGTIVITSCSIKKLTPQWYADQSYGGAALETEESVSLAGGGTITRPTTATYLKGGLVQGAATNLCLQSQNFGTTWTRGGILAFGSGSTVDATEAPDGTTTADLIVQDSSTGFHAMTMTANRTAGLVYCFSVYVKPKEVTRFILWDQASTFGRGFDTSTLLTYTPSGISAPTYYGIEVAANGFYRIYIAHAATGTTNQAFRVYLGTSNNDYIYTGDGVSGGYVWQGQLEVGTQPTTPIVTTTGTATRNATAAYITSAAQKCAVNNFALRGYVTPRALPSSGEAWVYTSTGLSGVYLNSSGKLVYRSGSLGADLVDTMNTAAAWTAYGANTVADDSGEVKITYVDNVNGAYAAMISAKGLSTDLTVGKTYEVTGSVRVSSGATIKVRLHDGNGVTRSVTDNITSTSKTTFTLRFTHTTSTTNLMPTDMGASEIVWFSDITVKEVKEITSTTTLSVGTEYLYGIEQSSTGGATLYIAGSSESTDATATSDLSWTGNHYIGSRYNGTGNDSHLNAVIQIETAQLSNVPSGWASGTWRA